MNRENTNDKILKTANTLIETCKNTKVKQIETIEQTLETQHKPLFTINTRES